MAKRALFALLLSALIVGAAFAQSWLSVGGGLMFDGGGVGSGTRAQSVTFTGHQVLVAWEEVNVRQFGFGAWVFADIRFLEISVGLLTGSSSVSIDGGSRSGESYTSLNISLLGKVPFYFGGLDVFPLFGIGVDGLLHWYDNLRIKFGGGVDIDLQRNVFLRASLLGSYRYPLNLRYDSWRDILRGDARYHNRSGGLGVTVKVGIGVRL